MNITTVTVYVGDITNLLIIHHFEQRTPLLVSVIVGGREPLATSPSVSSNPIYFEI